MVIYTSPRKGSATGKIAVWVGFKQFVQQIHVLEERNIWDLEEKEVTPNVLNAIDAAFCLGIELASKKASEILRRPDNIVFKPEEIK